MKSTMPTFAAAVPTQYAEMGKHAIDSFKRCKIIARNGIGVEFVDVDEAMRRNIVVTSDHYSSCRLLLGTSDSDCPVCIRGSSARLKREASLSPVNNVTMPFGIAA